MQLGFQCDRSGIVTNDIGAKAMDEFECETNSTEFDRIISCFRIARSLCRDKGSSLALRTLRKLRGQRSRPLRTGSYRDTSRPQYQNLHCYHRHRGYSNLKALVSLARNLNMLVFEQKHMVLSVTSALSNEHCYTPPCQSDKAPTSQRKAASALVAMVF